MNEYTMKISAIITLLIACVCAPLSSAQTPSTPLSYLKAMVLAHKTQNYEQLYIFQQGEEVDSLRYRHAYQNNKAYAQLLYLDNAREEMLLREGMVSYFGEFQPFSLASSRILDNLPAVLQTDFEQLSHYNFVDMGKTRVADRVARMIRIVPRDEFRYQYTLWIDEETSLLLKSELLDRNNNLLEQFRVIQSVVDEQLLEIVEPIKALILPPIAPAKAADKQPLTWQPQWLPEGFKAVSTGTQDLSAVLAEDEWVESQLYSDGLFSFTVYMATNRGVNFEEQFWREGKISIYSQTVGDKDVIIVGEIPLVSARHIVQEIQQNRPLVGEQTP